MCNILLVDKGYSDPTFGAILPACLQHRLTFAGSFYMLVTSFPGTGRPSGRRMALWRLHSNAGSGGNAAFVPSLQREPPIWVNGIEGSASSKADMRRNLDSMISSRITPLGRSTPLVYLPPPRPLGLVAVGRDGGGYDS